MNNDLISRTALGIGRCDPNVFNNWAYADGWNACIDIIESAPAVDAVPVVRAKWVKEEDRMNRWHCSNCKAVVGVAGRFGNYCLYCGAKMLEGETE